MRKNQDTEKKTEQEQAHIDLGQQENTLNLFSSLPLKTLLIILPKLNLKNLFNFLDWLISKGDQSLVDSIFKNYILLKVNEEALAESIYSIIDLAAKYNQLDFMRQQMADPEQKKEIITSLKKNIAPFTVLNYAVQFRHFEMINLILMFMKQEFESPIDLPLWSKGEYGYRGILNQAAINGDAELAVTLIEFILSSYKTSFKKIGFEGLRNPFRFLHIAAGKGYLDFIKSIINAIEKYNQGEENLVDSVLCTSNINGTPFVWAARFEHKELLDYLFANYPISGSQSLVSVSKHEPKSPMVYHHHWSLFCPTDYQETELSFDSHKIFKTLLDHGADINFTDKKGRTAFYYAVERIDLDLINFMIENGADINQRDNQGKTLLHFVTEYGKYPPYVITAKDRIEVIKVLIQAGVKIDEADKDGKTALYFAVERIDLDLSTFLIETGADVNQKESLITTILNIVTESGRYNSRLTAIERLKVIEDGIKIINVLIKAGANVHVTDNKRIIALHDLKESVIADIQRYEKMSIYDRIFFSGAPIEPPEIIIKSPEIQKKNSDDSNKLPAERIGFFKKEEDAEDNQKLTPTEQDWCFLI